MSNNNNRYFNAHKLSYSAHEFKHKNHRQAEFSAGNLEKVGEKFFSDSLSIELGNAPVKTKFVQKMEGVLSRESNLDKGSVVYSTTQSVNDNDGSEAAEEAPPQPAVLERCLSETTTRSCNFHQLLLDFNLEVNPSYSTVNDYICRIGDEIIDGLNFLVRGREVQSFNVKEGHSVESPSKTLPQLKASSSDALMEVSETLNITTEDAHDLFLRIKQVPGNTHFLARGQRRSRTEQRVVGNIKRQLCKKVKDNGYSFKDDDFQRNHIVKMESTLKLLSKFSVEHLKFLIRYIKEYSKLKYGRVHPFLKGIGGVNNNVCVDSLDNNEVRVCVSQIMEALPILYVVGLKDNIRGFNHDNGMDLSSNVRN